MPNDVKLLVTDFDGVHTDNSVTLDTDGNETVRVNRSDGLGTRLLADAGVPTLILTSEELTPATVRASKLGLTCLHARGEKGEILRRLSEQRQIDLSNMVYVGNDVNDYSAMTVAGTSIAVSDAHPSIMPVAHFITRLPGGSGAVREVIDRILQSITT
jgi:YrbI family 3-deoxy-D-manno-octulosonate 8-phosphate phosphatase